MLVQRVRIVCKGTEWVLLTVVFVQLFVMDLCSLEDDGYEQMFITQSSTSGNNNNAAGGSDSRRNGGILDGIYEDISDADDFEWPSLQVPNADYRY